MDMTNTLHHAMVSLAAMVFHHVAVASGATSEFTFNPLQAAETMTAHIARISGGDLSYNSIDYNSLFAIALMLFLVTLVLNLFSQWVVAKFREQYE